MSNPLPSSNADQTVKPITGHHVFWGFVVFFGIVFAMNAVFMYYAVSTHTGIDTTNSYRRGLNYNSRVRAEARQMKLGWQPVIALNKAADKIILNIKDRAGFPVPNLIVSAVLGRPATTEFDRKLAMKEVSPGRYEAGFDALNPGGWIVSIVAIDQTRSTDKTVYRLRKRLWLKPPT